MKKIILGALCALAMVFSFSSCSLFNVDESNPEVDFGWADGSSAQGINGYTCIGSLSVYVDAFQSVFEPLAEYKSFTTAGGSVTLKVMNTKKVDSYVKKYADKAISKAQSDCKSQGYNLPTGETFRVVYSYGASKKKTKVLDYPVK